MSEYKKKTVKFGGSSLADAEQFRKVRQIVLSDETRKYVIPSAPGKRYPGDVKVTDMLYKCYELARDKEAFDELFGKVTERFDGIIADLGLDLSLTKEYENIRSAMLHMSGRDYAASRGEYLNGRILAACLGYDFIDAFDVVMFRDDGTFDEKKTEKIMSDQLRKHERAVIPGFYGAMPNGTVRTFSRGGSDFTGSIVASVSGSDLYENWTDVSGFLTADPRIVENPGTIDKITYRELRELSYMGATVLHEDAVFPVRTVGIPINIRNTNRPEDRGTFIVPECRPGEGNVITGIAGRHGFSVICVEKDRMNSEVGFIRKVLSVLENNRLTCEHIPSGIDTMSVVIETASIAPVRELVLNTICTVVEPDAVSIEDGISLIAVVGRNMVRAKGTAARIIGSVAGAGVNIRMIDQGSDEMNVIIGVSDDDFEKAVTAIYNEFEKDRK
ncbi:MAG: aspartate kinase [Clostridia bacterium]|nr:aspartate kinase [Clostridia bacterium]